MRPVDLTSPRYRYKSKTVLNKDFAARFKTKFPQYSHYKDDTLIDIIKKHNNLIWNTVIEERDGVDLQGNAGHIFIGMTPPFKKKKIAFRESLKLGVKVYYNNHKTDGRVVKICYSNYKNKFRFANAILWEFEAVRQFKRNASSRCPEMWTKYCIIDSNKQMWNTLKKARNKDIEQKETKKVLVNYSEFDLI